MSNGAQTESETRGAGGGEGTRGGEARESLSSVQLMTNSKGVVQPTVKVYNDDPHVSSQTAQSIFDALLEKYGGMVKGDA